MESEPALAVTAFHVCFHGCNCASEALLQLQLSKSLLNIANQIHIDAGRASEYHQWK